MSSENKWIFRPSKDIGGVAHPEYWENEETGEIHHGDNLPSDTPRTDAACGEGRWMHCVDDDFARGLERDLADARATITELDRRAKIDNERIREFLAEIQRLRDLLGLAMEPWNEKYRRPDWWYKAKEALAPAKGGKLE